MDVLVQTDDEIKQIILNDTPTELIFPFGNGSFTYKLQSDINNFDPLLMSNSLIELITGLRFDRLLKEHMEIFMLCTGKDPENTIDRVELTDAWIKFF
jgi:hypothetical protein